MDVIESLAQSPLDLYQFVLMGAIFALLLVVILQMHQRKLLKQSELYLKLASEQAALQQLLSETILPIAANKQIDVRGFFRSVSIESVHKEDPRVLLLADQMLGLYARQLELRSLGAVNARHWSLWQRHWRAAAQQMFWRSAWSRLRDNYEHAPSFQTVMDRTLAVPASLNRPPLRAVTREIGVAAQR